MKRRQLLAGSSAVAAALFARRVPDVQAAERNPTDAAQDADASEDPLELLPAGSAIESEYARLVSADLADVDDPEEVVYPARSVIDIDGLGLEDVDELVTTWSTEHEQLGALRGSFDRLELGEEVDERGDWWLGDDPDEGLAVASTDGRLAFAGESDADTRTDLVDAAVDAATGDVDSLRAGSDAVDAVAEHLGEYRLVYHIFDVDAGLPAELADSIASFAAGFDDDPSDRHGTVETEFVFEPASDGELDDEAITAIVEELERGNVVELDTEREDGVVLVEAVTELPPERAREAAPDAQVRLRPTPDEGVAVLEHEGGEAIPAGELDLWVNGELADAQPADAFDQFEPGDTIEVDTGPLATVVLRWLDGDEERYTDYVDEVVGEDSFEIEYDVAAETVELRYTGGLDADPDRLTLTHHQVEETDDGSRRRRSRERRDDLLAELDGTLATGETIAVDDVGIGDRLTLALDVPAKPPTGDRSEPTLVRFRARPPRLSIRRRPGEQPRLTYWGDRSSDAAAFTVRVDGELADTQPADEHATLAEGDHVELGDIEFGSAVVVEWTEPDEPVVVAEQTIEPRMHLSVEYDDSDGTVAIAADHSDEVDAEALELLVDGEPADTQPGDEYDTFGAGDELTATAPPFVPVELRWTGGDEDRPLDGGVTGRGLFGADYDPDAGTIDLVYLGAQEADPERLVVEQHGGRRDADEKPSQPFAEAHDTLTQGDSVTIEDVAPEDRLWVRLADGDVHRAGHRPLFRVTPMPRHAFRIEQRDGETVAVYTGRIDRDADEFRVLLDGVPADTQPADVHDTLGEGDELALGSLPTETEVVIEWTAPDEPTEVASHVVEPDAAFDVEYDAEAEEIAIEHAGGDELDAEEVGVYAEPITDDLVPWDGDDTVSEGDVMRIDATEQPEMLVVVYRRRAVLHEERFEG